MMRLVTRLGGTARGVPQPSTGITGDCALFAIAICHFTGENIRDRSNVANIAANVIRIRPTRYARGVRDGIAMHPAESKSKTKSCCRETWALRGKARSFACVRSTPYDIGVATSLWRYINVDPTAAVDLGENRKAEPKSGLTVAITDDRVCRPTQMSVPARKMNVFVDCRLHPAPGTSIPGVTFAGGALSPMRTRPKCRSPRWSETDRAPAFAHARPAFRAVHRFTMLTLRRVICTRACSSASGSPYGLFVAMAEFVFFAPLLWFALTSLRTADAGLKLSTEHRRPSLAMDLSFARMELGHAHD